MPYFIDWSELAMRQLQVIGKLEAERITRKLFEASVLPDHYFKRLTEREEYRLRIGDYRVIAQISHSEKYIFVKTVDHRSHVYKR